jgi:hypothetical protein
MRVVHVHAIPGIGGFERHLRTRMPALAAQSKPLRRPAPLLDDETLVEVINVFEDYFGAARANADCGASLSALSAEPTVGPIALVVNRLALLTATGGARNWAALTLVSGHIRTRQAPLTSARFVSALAFSESVSLDPGEQRVRKPPDRAFVALAGCRHEHVVAMRYR